MDKRFHRLSCQWWLSVSSSMRFCQSSCCPKPTGIIGAPGWELTNLQSQHSYWSCCLVRFYMVELYPVLRPQLQIKCDKKLQIAFSIILWRDREWFSAMLLKSLFVSFEFFLSSGDLVLYLYNSQWMGTNWWQNQWGGQYIHYSGLRAFLWAHQSPKPLKYQEALS